MQIQLRRCRDGVPLLAGCGLDAPPVPDHALQHPERAPVVFFWWATSPQGRRTVHSRVSRFERLVPSEQTTPEGETVMVPTHCYGSSTTDLHARLCATAHAVLPHLPHGYTWHGPFLVWDAPVPTREGPYLGSFHFKRRVPSGRPATMPPKGDLGAARALAHRILRRLAPA